MPFEIKSFDWDTSGPGEDGDQNWIVKTPFGNYTIRSFHESQPGIFTWSYCFDEYWDEGQFDAKTLEDAKQAAWNHWVERLSSALTEITD